MAAIRYIAILIVIAALAGMIWWTLGRGGEMDRIDVEIAGETFTLEIAANRAAIERGLMEVEEIDPHGGMIFVFLRPYSPGFWMKNCVVDIDLVYLDEARKVIETHTMKVEQPQGPDESDSDYEARLTRYTSPRPVSFAVELKAGTIERLGLVAGDQLLFDHLALKRLAR